jgi:acetyl-CoA synthetase
MPLKQCTIGCQIPGFEADVFDNSGKRASEGYLVVKKPWPSMTRGLLTDPDRFIETYWSNMKTSGTTVTSCLSIPTGCGKYAAALTM